MNIDANSSINGVFWRVNSPLLNIPLPSVRPICHSKKGTDPTITVMYVRNSVSTPIFLNSSFILVSFLFHVSHIWLVGKNHTLFLGLIGTLRIARLPAYLFYLMLG